VRLASTMGRLQDQTHHIISRYRLIACCSFIDRHFPATQRVGKNHCSISIHCLSSSIAMSFQILPIISAAVLRLESFDIIVSCLPLVCLRLRENVTLINARIFSTAAAHMDSLYSIIQMLHSPPIAIPSICVRRVPRILNERYDSSTWLRRCSGCHYAWIAVALSL
jgi:hypothetical protein